MLWMLLACADPPPPPAPSVPSPPPPSTPAAEPAESRTGPPAELPLPPPAETDPAGGPRLGVGTLRVENPRSVPVLVDCGHAGQVPALPGATTEVPIPMRPALCVVVHEGTELARWELPKDEAAPVSWTLTVPR